MDWLKTILPTIATALGGPLAGVAVNFVADKLGLSDQTTEAVQAAISGATPEQLVQLKQIDADLQKYFAGLNIDLEKVAAGDRASAREREVNAHDTWTPRLLAFGITAGFFGVLAYLLHYGKPPLGGDALLVMLGALGTAWASVVAYYFGSSAGSAAKSTLMAQAAARK